MANQFKSIGLVVILVGAGVVIFVLGLGQNKSQDEQGVVLQEIFKQKAPVAPSNTVQAPAVNATAKDPVPPMAIVTSPGDKHDEGFAIQVYSLQDKARAESALESLKNNGYNNAFIVMTDLGEKGLWYRVRVGHIADEDAARKLLEEIRKNYASGILIKPKV